MIITEAYIKERFEAVKKEALEATHYPFGETSERIRVANASLVVKDMAALGTAYRNGKIEINKAYIGTSAVDHLEDTIRHEFAHLAVDWGVKHGPEWKEMAVRLGAIPRATHSIPREFADNHYNWYLYADLEDGRTLYIKGYKRKSPKYKHGTEWRYNIKGTRIVKWIWSRRRLH